MLPGHSVKWPRPACCTGAAAAQALPTASQGVLPASQGQRTAALEARGRPPSGGHCGQCSPQTAASADLPSPQLPRLPRHRPQPHALCAARAASAPPHARCCLHARVEEAGAGRPPAQQPKAGQRGRDLPPHAAVPMPPLLRAVAAVRCCCCCWRSEARAAPLPEPQPRPATLVLACPQAHAPLRQPRAGDAPPQLLPLRCPPPVACGRVHRPPRGSPQPQCASSARGARHGQAWVCSSARSAHCHRAVAPMPRYVHSAAQPAGGGAARGACLGREADRKVSQRQASTS